MPSQDTRELEGTLRRSQHKLTRPRQAVLDTLATAQEHLTPAEVHLRAKARYPRLGLTTVYRTLELLAELGLVCRIHRDDGCHSYAVRNARHGHHLVCSRCGRAVEFADCNLQALVEALQARTGFRIEGHILELTGQCPSCLAE